MKCKMVTIKLASITVTLHGTIIWQMRMVKIDFLCKNWYLLHLYFEEKTRELVKVLLSRKNSTSPYMPTLFELIWDWVTVSLSKLKHIWWTFIFHEFNYYYQIAPGRIVPCCSIQNKTKNMHKLQWTCGTRKSVV